MSRNAAEDAGTAPAPEPLPDKTDGEIQKLKDEIVSLKIDKAARDQVVAMLRDERAKITETAMEANRRVGELETRLQLAAPREADSIPIHRQPPSASQEKPWGRVY